MTADAAHTVKARARLICEDLLGHRVLTVEFSTRKLYHDLDAPGADKFAADQGW